MERAQPAASTHACVMPICAQERECYGAGPGGTRGGAGRLGDEAPARSADEQDVSVGPARLLAQKPQRPARPEMQAPSVLS